MLAIVILSVVHVFMVFAVDPFDPTSMITGTDPSSLGRGTRPFRTFSETRDSGPRRRRGRREQRSRTNCVDQ